MTEMDAQTQSDLRQVIRWADLRDEAERELHMEVRKAHKRGATTRQIGVALDISHTSVQRILDGPKELPQGWLRPVVTGEERSRQASEPPRGGEQPKLGKKPTKGRYAGRPGSEA